MNELKELLDAIEKRAEAATFENWGRIARADVPALVKAVNILAGQVEICGCSDCEQALKDSASILKGKQP